MTAATKHCHWGGKKHSASRHHCLLKKRRPPISTGRRGTGWGGESESNHSFVSWRLPIPALSAFTGSPYPTHFSQISLSPPDLFSCLGLDANLSPFTLSLRLYPGEDSHQVCQEAVFMGRKSNSSLARGGMRQQPGNLGCRPSG